MKGPLSCKIFSVNLTECLLASLTSVFSFSCWASEKLLLNTHFCRPAPCDVTGGTDKSHTFRCQTLVLVSIQTCRRCSIESVGLNRGLNIPYSGESYFSAPCLLCNANRFSSDLISHFLHSFSPRESFRTFRELSEIFSDDNNYSLSRELLVKVGFLTP